MPSDDSSAAGKAQRPSGTAARRHNGKTASAEKSASSEEGQDASSDASGGTRDPSLWRPGTWELWSEEVRVDAKRALIGGVLAAGVTGVGAWLVGEASGAEARVLLETTLPSARAFCGTVTISLGNVLALMLTLLSMSSGAEVDLKWAHYQRVKQIAWIDAVTLVASILIYQLLNIPLVEAEAAQETGYSLWYASLYYTTLGLTSLLGGALISVVLMLYNTVRDIIQALGPDQDSRLVRSEEEAEEEAEEAREEAEEAREKERRAEEKEREAEEEARKRS